MPRGSGALLCGLCGLEIGAEVTRSFDDFFVLWQSLPLETAQCRLDILGVERFGKRCGIVRRLGNSGGNMRPRHKGGITDNRHLSKGEVWTFEIVYWLQNRLLDQRDDRAELRCQQAFSRCAHG